MPASLTPQATAAQEATRTLERSLESSRPHWDDSTRQNFDQRHAASVITAGRTTARELSTLAHEMNTALASLEQ